LKFLDMVEQNAALDSGAVEFRMLELGRKITIGHAIQMRMPALSDTLEGADVVFDENTQVEELLTIVND